MPGNASCVAAATGESCWRLPPRVAHVKQMALFCAHVYAKCATGPLCAICERGIVVNMDTRTVLAKEADTAPLGEQAYLALRRSIVRCDFEPGERLRIEELGRQFGLSSSPLREALNRLVQQGLVRSLENRGFRVAPISVEGIADLTRVRVLIESEALRDALVHGTEEWEGGVVAAFHGLSTVEKKLTEGPLVLDDKWSDRHRAFHLAIYSGTTSPLLKMMLESLFDQAERYRRFSARFRKVERAKGTEHQRIVDAVLARDHEKSLKLVQNHIRSTERNVTESLLAIEKTRTH